MSRSYKHSPISKQRNDQTYKKIAARKIRNAEDEDSVPNGNAYKKMYERWNICDWKLKDWSVDKFIEENFEEEKSKNPEISDEDVRKNLKHMWEKWYRNK